MSESPPAHPADEPQRPRHPGFAVVGLGKMGIMHAAMLSVIPGAHVCALVDPDTKTAAQVRSMLGGDQRFFTGLEACLDTARPEGVFLATPQFTHRALVEICLSRGVPVFCEK